MTRFVCVVVCMGLALVAVMYGAVPNEENQADESVAARITKKRGSFLTVLDLGAKGDGEADDTAAIQEIIDAKCGSIRFPAGAYRITKPLVVELDRVGLTSFVADGTARLIMDGAGPAIRFVGTHTTGSAAPNTVKPEVWDRQRMPVVEGLAIVGNHEEADGIEAAGTFQLTLRGVHIRKCRHGVHLVNRNRNVLIDGCHIYENSGSGVFYDHVDLHQSNISASHISYCRQGGVVVRGGNVRNIHIAGCDIEANESKDGPPSANVLLDCADGSVAEVAITGCTIQHGKEAPDSANIRILGRGFMERRGEQMPFNCGNVTIGNNVLSDVQTNIHLDGVRGVTITGNTFWQGYEHNLLVENSSHVIVGPNMMERNPLYSYTSEGKCNVVFRDCRDCTINGLHLHNVIDSEAGLTIEKCQRMHVVGCTILDCDNVGLLVKASNDIHWDASIISDSRDGAESLRVKVVDAAGKVVEQK
ncbi:MAG TPA: right-handed parallel beta-helix repeat-containing protein [Pirellulaceae bacterium]